MNKKESCRIQNSMGESNTVESAYTLYRHLQQYCSHPSINIFFFFSHLLSNLLLLSFSASVSLLRDGFHFRVQHFEIVSSKI